MHLLNIEILKQLEKIEIQLVALDLYTPDSPSPAALKSTFPFCYDSMEFHQWLQWKLLPTLRELAKTEFHLPNTSNIQAIAELEFAKMEQDTDQLLDTIRELDHYLNNLRPE